MKVSDRSSTRKMQASTGNYGRWPELRLCFWTSLAGILIAFTALSSTSASEIRRCQSVLASTDNPGTGKRSAVLLSQQSFGGPLRPVFVTAPSVGFASELSGPSEINTHLLTWENEYPSKLSGTRVHRLNLEPAIEFLALDHAPNRLQAVSFVPKDVAPRFNLETLQRVRPSFDGPSNRLDVIALTTSLVFRIHTEHAIRLSIELFHNQMKYSLEVTHDGSGLKEFVIPTESLRSSKRKNSLGDSGIVIKASADQGLRASTAVQPIRFSVVGPIVFERDPRDRVLMQATIDRVSLAAPSGTLDTLGWANTAVTTYVNNIFDPDARAYARKVMASKELLGKFLSANELSLRFLEDRIPITGSRGFFAADQRRSIPIEGGQFAIEHSADGHLGQLIAGTYNTQPTIRRIVVDMFVGIVRMPVPLAWQAWNIIFDGPGNRLPTTPRYWRDQIP